MLAQSSGQEIQAKAPIFNRARLMPWAENPEFGSIAINWPENLYFASQLRVGVYLFGTHILAEVFQLLIVVKVDPSTPSAYLSTSFRPVGCTR